MHSNFNNSLHTATEILKMINKNGCANKHPNCKPGRSVLVDELLGVPVHPPGD